MQTVLLTRLYCVRSTHSGASISATTGAGTAPLTSGAASDAATGAGAATLAALTTAALASKAADSAAALATAAASRSPRSTWIGRQPATMCSSWHVESAKCRLRNKRISRSTSAGHTQSTYWPFHTRMKSSHCAVDMISSTLIAVASEICVMDGIHTDAPPSLFSAAAATSADVAVTLCTSAPPLLPPPLLRSDDVLALLALEAPSSFGAAASPSASHPAAEPPAATAFA